MNNSITCDINNPHGLLFIFSKVLLFFRTWRSTPAMQLSVAKLIVTKGNEHTGKISMSLLLVTRFSVNKLQLPMVTTEFSI